MQTGFLTKAGAHTIERVDVPRNGPALVNSVPAAGVLHTTEGSFDSALSEFKQHFAPHFMVGPGRILQFVPLGTGSAALEHPAGSIETNAFARAQIEVVGFSQEDPYQFDARTLDTLADLMAELVRATGIPLSRPFPDALEAKPWATRDFVRRHAGKWGKAAGWYGHIEIPGNDHWDPGQLQWSGLLAACRHKLHAGPGVVHPPPVAPPVDHGPPAPGGRLVAAMRAPAGAAIRLMQRSDHGEYTDGEVASIVNRYYATARPVGLDPLLVVSQMIEETGNLTSFWSQRPRRNPAGIGVTGEPGKGVKFANWEQAVRAHTGRLLAYAVAPAARTPGQSALVAEALAFRELPGNLHGAAPTLQGLVGHWAQDPQYAVNIAAIANRIRTHST